MLDMYGMAFMIKIQLSQMSVAKLAIGFSLQAYLGIIVIHYKSQAFSVL